MSPIKTYPSRWWPRGIIGDGDPYRPGFDAPEGEKLSRRKIIYNRSILILLSSLLLPFFHIIFFPNTFHMSLHYILIPPPSSSYILQLDPIFFQYSLLYPSLPYLLLVSRTSSSLLTLFTGPWSFIRLLFTPVSSVGVESILYIIPLTLSSMFLSYRKLEFRPINSDCYVSLLFSSALLSPIYHSTLWNFTSYIFKVVHQPSTASSYSLMSCSLPVFPKIAISLFFLLIFSQNPLHYSKHPARFGLLQLVWCINLLSEQNHGQWVFILTVEWIWSFACGDEN